ncbi:hypothetical protein HYH03_002789 [Edaphochlamys debaryana]|uniref:Cysteine dioxygenase n=1 Tax=Edaphochlamys debaryana TaxID=47281 RepID=A0A835YDD5_9CHLO|nr:hypothetical protein HYH03_002789 [Edaphochlamys debaryana]|eukprot:KAG2499208.1 hypothetical protein HYH03_002789 [Edaphochlamys debaryana]
MSPPVLAALPACWAGRHLPSPEAEPSLLSLEGAHRGSGLDVLLGELAAAFEAEKQRGVALGCRQERASRERLSQRVRQVLEAYARSHPSDWRQFAAWGDHGYLRHLLLGTDDFEVMLLCWKPGQVSRVHNHDASNCWVSVLAGRMAETLYRLAGSRDAGQQQQQPEKEEGAQEKPAPGADAGAQAAEVVPTGTHTLEVGDVGYISDLQGLHSLGSVGGAGAVPAATLHVYSPPIRRVRLYEGGRVTESTPGFYSRHAFRQGGRPAPAGLGWCYGHGEGI